MNTKDLEYVLMIAKEQSISKAAEKLYMTQPALSIFLNRLENQLDAPLFQRRGPSGLALTYAGERYVAMAQKVVNMARNFEQELLEINAMRMGRLRIGTSAHIGSLVLPKVIPEFNKIYPNIEVAITEGHSHALERLIQSCELDAALMHLPLRSLDAQYTEIKRERFVMAIANSHPLTEKIYHKQGENIPYIDPREAKDEQFVLAFPHQRVRQISDIILDRAGIIPQVRLMTSSVQTALRFAGAGLGITFLPESYVQLFRCEDDPLLCYMEDEFHAFWTFSIVCPKEQPLTAPVKEFVRITERIY